MQLEQRNLNGVNLKKSKQRMGNIASGENEDLRLVMTQPER